MEKQESWLDERLAYIRGLKSPSDQQSLLLLLADKPDRTQAEDRSLSALVKAEKAADRAQRARAEAAKVVNAEKAQKRKARDHELYKSAALMIVAGLVSTETGQPTMDRGELVGALAMLAAGFSSGNLSPEKRAAWKRHGDSIIAGKAKASDSPQELQTPPHLVQPAFAPAALQDAQDETPDWQRRPSY